jgi:hypothetical protein
VDFFALKNPTASAEFEPTNLGTKGQHATPRPPKPLAGRVTFPTNKAAKFQGDCTLMLWMLFALHVSLWHLMYTLISVFCAHALMMIFTLIETVTVNCHLI